MLHALWRWRPFRSAGARPSRVPVDPAAPGVPQERRRVVPAAAGTDGRARPATPDVPGVPGARRPLMCADRGLAGFEFHVAESLIVRGRRRDDEVIMRSCTAGVFAAMRLASRQQWVGLVELPWTWVAAALPIETFTDGMWLALGPSPGWPDAGTLDSLARAVRARGGRVGWRRGAVADPGVRPDFLLLGPDDDAFRPPSGGAGPVLVAPDLRDLSRMTAALAAGVRLAGCRLGTPEPRQPRELAPAAQQLLRLLHETASAADISRVTTLIQRDAALSLRLLQHINSAGQHGGAGFESIHQAVLWLGRDALYRWVARLLVRQAPAQPAGLAVQQFALARARLMELLGRQAQAPRAGTDAAADDPAAGTAAGEPPADDMPAGLTPAGGLYLTGLVSLLPAMLSCRLDDALRSLPLPEAARQALVGGRGPWAAHLQLAIALENADTAQIRRLAGPFGGEAAVAALAAQAWDEAVG